MIIFLILFFSMSASAEEKNNQKEAPYFTNEDLEKYKTPADAGSGVKPGLPENKADSKAGQVLDKKSKKNVKRYEIPYEPYEGEARRIIVPVTMNGNISTHMLLDTGAPGMQISFKLAEQLGVLDEDSDRLWTGVSGIGGTALAIFTIIETIQVGDAKDHFIPTVVSYLPSSEYDGLIGMDFLSKYYVRIDTTKKLLIMEEPLATSEMPAGHDEEWWRMTFRKFEAMMSAWEDVKEYFDRKEDNTARQRELKAFANNQYKTARELNDRLRVYASDNAVPREWR